MRERYSTYNVYDESKHYGELSDALSKTVKLVQAAAREEIDSTAETAIDLVRKAVERIEEMQAEDTRILSGLCDIITRSLHKNRPEIKHTSTGYTQKQWSVVLRDNSAAEEYALTRREAVAFMKGYGHAVRTLRRDVLQALVKDKKPGGVFATPKPEFKDSLRDEQQPEREEEAA